jgi:carbonic anhydrase
VKRSPEQRGRRAFLVRFVPRPPGRHVPPAATGTKDLLASRRGGKRLNPVRGGAIGKRKGDAMQKLFARNKTWSDRIKEINPDFFTNLARQQNPEYLWIGCADSRVPANQIVDLPPGEVFVHRNIANVVVPTDLNCLSVLQYAVEVLRVRAVIVCGHYGCGGIDAALADQELGLIDNWLNHIRAVHRLHKPIAFEACARRSGGALRSAVRIERGGAGEPYLRHDHRAPRLGRGPGPAGLWRGLPPEGRHPEPALREIGVEARGRDHAPGRRHRRLERELKSPRIALEPPA